MAETRFAPLLQLTGNAPLTIIRVHWDDRKFSQKLVDLQARYPDKIHLVDLQLVKGPREGLQIGGSQKLSNGREAQQVTLSLADFREMVVGGEKLTFPADTFYVYMSDSHGVGEDLHYTWRQLEPYLNGRLVELERQAAEEAQAKAEAEKAKAEAEAKATAEEEARQKTQVAVERLRKVWQELTTQIQKLKEEVAPLMREVERLRQQPKALREEIGKLEEQKRQADQAAKELEIRRSAAQAETKKLEEEQARLAKEVEQAKEEAARARVEKVEQQGRETPTIEAQQPPSPLPWFLAGAVAGAAGAGYIGYRIGKEQRQRPPQQFPVPPIVETTLPGRPESFERTEGTTSTGEMETAVQLKEPSPAPAPIPTSEATEHQEQELARRLEEGVRERALELFEVVEGKKADPDLSPALDPTAILENEDLLTSRISQPGSLFYNLPERKAAEAVFHWADGKARELSSQLGVPEDAAPGLARKIISGAAALMQEKRAQELREKEEQERQEREKTQAAEAARAQREREEAQAIQDTIRQRAYFKSLDRAHRGEPPNPDADWLEAGAEWRAEAMENIAEELQAILSHSLQKLQETASEKALRDRAQEIYRDRLARGEPGDENSDWLQAESDLRAEALKNLGDGLQQLQEAASERGPDWATPVRDAVKYHLEHTVSEGAIRNRAQALWIAKGSPPWQDETGHKADWLRAEAELRAEAMKNLSSKLQIVLGHTLGELQEVAPEGVVAQRAHAKYQARGGEPGYDRKDWFEVRAELVKEAMEKLASDLEKLKAATSEQPEGVTTSDEVTGQGVQAPSGQPQPSDWEVVVPPVPSLVQIAEVGPPLVGTVPEEAVVEMEAIERPQAERRQEMSRLQGEWEATTQRLKAARAEADDLERQRTESTDQLRELRRELDAGPARIEGLTQERDTLQQEVTYLENEQARLAGEVQQVRGELAKAEEELKETQPQLALRQREEQAVAERLDQVRGEMTAAELTFRETHEQIAQARVDLERTQQQIEELQHRRDSEQASMASAGTRLQQDLTNLETGKIRLGSELAQVEEKLQEAQGLLREVQENVRELEDQRGAAMGALAMLGGEHTALQGIVENLRRERDDLEGAIRGLRETRIAVVEAPSAEQQEVDGFTQSITRLDEGLRQYLAPPDRGVDEQPAALIIPKEALLDGVGVVSIRRLDETHQAMVIAVAGNFTEGEKALLRRLDPKLKFITGVTVSDRGSAARVLKAARSAAWWAPDVPVRVLVPTLDPTAKPIELSGGRLLYYLAPDEANLISLDLLLQVIHRDLFQPNSPVVQTILARISIESAGLKDQVSDFRERWALAAGA